MNSNEEMILLKTKMKDYKSGKLKSKSYTKSELRERRIYFESQLPSQILGIEDQRWLYEIKRIFDLSNIMSECPDYGITRLEYILKFGL